VDVQTFWQEKLPPTLQSIVSLNDSSAGIDLCQGMQQLKHAKIALSGEEDTMDYKPVAICISSIQAVPQLIGVAV
jgi:hypothetical protein